MQAKTLLQGQILPGGKNEKLNLKIILNIFVLSIIVLPLKPKFYQEQKKTFRKKKQTLST